MLLDIDIALSLSITTSGALLFPALFRPSYAMPPVSAPSPITAATLPRRPCNLIAEAIPNAADIEVLLCPEMKASAVDSFRRVKPDIPFRLLSVLNSE